jgi:hypothetical protein
MHIPSSRFAGVILDSRGELYALYRGYNLTRSGHQLSRPLCAQKKGGTNGLRMNWVGARDIGAEIREGTRARMHCPLCIGGSICSEPKK